MRVDSRTLLPPLPQLLSDGAAVWREDGLEGWLPTVNSRFRFSFTCCIAFMVDWLYADCMPIESVFQREQAALEAGWLLQLDGGYGGRRLWRGMVKAS